MQTLVLLGLTVTVFASRAALSPEQEEKLRHSLIHRGDGKNRPDNTMEALLYTWARGFTPECDIRYSKDGKILAFHDGKYGGRPVRDYTWAEIREWDVGSYRDPSYATCRPPLWETIFTAMEENLSRRIHIDCKDVPPEKIAELVRAHGLEKRAYFICKDYATVKRYKAALPEGVTVNWMSLGRIGRRRDFNDLDDLAQSEENEAKLFRTAEADGFSAATIVQLHCQARRTGTGWRFVPREATLIDWKNRLHAAGVEASIFVWMEEGSDPAVYEYLFHLGFDSFGTDYPEALYRAVERMDGGVK